MEFSIQRKLARIPSDSTPNLSKYPTFLPKPRRFGLLWGSQIGILLGVPSSLVCTYEFLLRTKINSISMEIQN